MQRLGTNTKNPCEPNRDLNASCVATLQWTGAESKISTNLLPLHCGQMARSTKSIMDCVVAPKSVLHKQKHVRRVLTRKNWQHLVRLPLEVDVCRGHIALDVDGDRHSQETLGDAFHSPPVRPVVAAPRPENLGEQTLRGFVEVPHVLGWYGESVHQPSHFLVHL